MKTPNLVDWLIEQELTGRQWTMAHRIAAGLLEIGVTIDDLQYGVGKRLHLIPAPFLLELSNAISDITRRPDLYTPT